MLNSFFICGKVLGQGVFTTETYMYTPREVFVVSANTV